MTLIAERLHQVQHQLGSASVQIVAVSKKASVEQMRQAYQAGLTCFGESYWQVAMPKMEALADLPITWCFIGRLQSNKCAKIAERFSWVLSVSHWHHAQLLNAACMGKKQLNICVEVNASAEAQKEGVALVEVPDFLQRLQSLSQLRVRGLMAIPAPHDKDAFQRVAKVFKHGQATMPSDFDTLSMGMSDDYWQAVQAGANQIRLGSYFFEG